MCTPQRVKHGHTLEWSVSDIKNDRIPIRGNNLVGISSDALTSKKRSCAGRRVVNGFTNSTLVEQVPQSHALGQGVRGPKIVVLQVNCAKFCVAIVKSVTFLKTVHDSPLSDPVHAIGHGVEVVANPVEQFAPLGQNEAHFV